MPGARRKGADIRFYAPSEVHRVLEHDMWAIEVSGKYFKELYIRLIDALKRLSYDLRDVKFDARKQQ